MTWEDIYENETLPHYESRRDEILEQERAINPNLAVCRTNMLIEIMAEMDARILSSLRD